MALLVNTESASETLSDLRRTEWHQLHASLELVIWEVERAVTQLQPLQKQLALPHKQTISFSVGVQFASEPLYP